MRLSLNVLTEYLRKSPWSWNVVVSPSRGIIFTFESDSSSSESDVETSSVISMSETSVYGVKTGNGHESGPEEDDGEGPVVLHKGDPTLAFRSANETQPIVKRSQVTKIDDMAEVQRIGEIQSVVGTAVIIQSSMGGQFRVLDTDSLLVFEDRTVLGFVSLIFLVFYSVELEHIGRSLKRSVRYAHPCMSYASIRYRKLIPRAYDPRGKYSMFQTIARSSIRSNYTLLKGVMRAIIGMKRSWMPRTSATTNKKHFTAERIKRSQYSTALRIITTNLLPSAVRRGEKAVDPPRGNKIQVGSTSTQEQRTRMYSMVTLMTI